jgi:serine protease Do
MRTISAFTLILALFALAGCSKPEPISQTHQGRIEAGDQVLSTDNSFYDVYSFEAAEGMTITATMVSTEFDTYIHLVDADGNQLVHNDDDATMGAGPGGATTNSKVTFVANRTGTYSVWANTLSAGDTGAYTVTINTTAP